jgi:hypothetical protein
MPDRQVLVRSRAYQIDAGLSCVWTVPLRGSFRARGLEGDCKVTKLVAFALDAMPDLGDLFVRHDRLESLTT